MKQEIKTENRNFTCSNPKCRRAFANPIIVCPHCLTEIKETLDETLPIEKKPTLTPSETNRCSYHFGYLSQLSGVKETPEECMICEKLIECRLSRFDSTPPGIESENAEEVKQPAEEEPVKEKPVEEPAKIEIEKQPVEVTVQEAASDSQQQKTEMTKEKQREQKKRKRWLLDSIKFPT